MDLKPEIQPVNTGKTQKASNNTNIDTFRVTDELAKISKPSRLRASFASPPNPRSLIKLLECKNSIKNSIKKFRWMAMSDVKVPLF